jgi:serine protease Do
MSTPEEGYPAADPNETHAAELRQSIMAVPSPVMPNLQIDDVAEAAPRPPLVVSHPVPVPPPPAGSRFFRGLREMLGPLTFFLVVVLIVVFAVPLLLARWRAIDGQTEAEVAYQRRRAELRAEAEAAQQMLDLLDKRVNLVSLGFRQVVRKVTPTVVNVSSYVEPRAEGGLLGKAGPPFVDPDSGRKYRQAGVGSGVIVRSGYILTNYHVVRDADHLRVTFASGRSLGLSVPECIVSDPQTDLAVLRLPSSPPAELRPDMEAQSEFADSDKDVHRGDLVIALGSPLGLKQTVTHGIISAKGRLLDRITLVELLQTDAAINPGNSGGPLFDQYGRIAGINVAIASDNGGNQGIGFAIPSNTAKSIFEKLVSKGEVVRGYIGVVLSEMGKKEAQKLGLGKSGAVEIAQVVPNQAAAQAGLKVGDVIVTYNKNELEQINPVRQLRQMILDTDAGQKAAFEILRNGKRQTVGVTIGKRPTDLP